MAAVARADVARTAVTVLNDVTAHRNLTYDLTGPEALTMTEVAAILSTAGTALSGTAPSGTAPSGTVRYHDETLPEAYESRRPWGAPDWQVDAWVSTYTAIAAGEMAEVSTAVETITGVKPISLAQLLAG